MKTIKAKIAATLRALANKLDPKPVTTQGGGGPGEER